MARGKALINAVKPEHSFMSVIGDRAPKQKSHDTLSKARAALAWRINDKGRRGTATDMWIYERDADGAWQTRHFIHENSVSAPWQKTQSPKDTQNV